MNKYSGALNMRIDIFLVKNGYAAARGRAKTLVESGAVLINGKTVQKVSSEVAYGDIVDVREPDMQRFVSRGGLKLRAALDSFKIDVGGLTAIDIGASTGGFTDCLLQGGALKVYSVDSGVGQLHRSIACDKRVVSIEKYNARNIKYDDFGFLFDIAVMDVSFISQKLIIPNLKLILKESAVFISLIKPQFEAGREYIGKGGIVRSHAGRALAVKNVVACAHENGLVCGGIIPSPIRGGDGNLEYLAAFSGLYYPADMPGDDFITNITADVNNFGHETLT